ncbi:MAG TPA: GTP cyclohydrolase I [Polyangiaceae bacterium LLY-WYZ-15_(1-7)]|nr:GTP cyclohydrolase I FolE [Sandaracinus sp.]HJL00475.1 GTP cyclohydrolase I [Polyangiaceae bacterium LLY-WYZ-15_(1-7)]MBJ71156.1 GTP cyclohydrolase I FolE [Sandaracinus sp.]HJL12415.1 GTP cyclohydrolase I [Polyangiaceae bacterium LLY-WYZ-15_(1-7)]HJL21233.1 GTP cyclohydrolase I [Polyangiaceae bacterium LLY-WYZ-15_(1-7)]
MTHEPRNGPEAPPPDLQRAAEAIEAFLEALGHPPSSDPELAETGRRVAEAWANDLLAGYREDPAAILADTCASEAPGLVAVTGIATTAVCPHHLLPATGVVHVAYLPRAKVVGLGALGRLIHARARRMVLQEDLGQQIADDLVAHLDARAAGCLVDLVPTCMTARGGREVQARAITVAFAGEADAEFRRAVLDRFPRHP